MNLIMNAHVHILLQVSLEAYQQHFVHKHCYCGVAYCTRHKPGKLSHQTLRYIQAFPWWTEIVLRHFERIHSCQMLKKTAS